MTNNNKAINICTFPRSGSTFLYKNLLNYIDTNRVAKHHSIDMVEFLENVTIVTIVRNPKDSFSSMMTMKFNTVKDNNKYDFIYEKEFLYLYELYAKHLNFYLNNLDKITVFKFEEVIEDVHRVIRLVLNIPNNTNNQNYTTVFPENSSKDGFLNTSKNNENYKNFINFINTKDLSPLYDLYNKLISSI